MSTHCPICSSASREAGIIHERWKVPLLGCPECSHVFSSRYVDEPEDSFKTNQKRANAYLRGILTNPIHSAIDVGTPRDFYWLEKIHAAKPKARLLALDLYDKAHPPHIELVHSFEGLAVDLCTAFHVLEHVQDPMSFVKSIARAGKQFIIEVPGCDTSANVIVSSGQPHMQFFNARSFLSLFQRANIGATVARRTGDDMPPGRTMLVAYRLPKEHLPIGLSAIDSRG